MRLVFRKENPPSPKRFIGVGYQDKGSRLDPSIHGTPKWQEVASCLNLGGEAQIEYSPRDPPEIFPNLRFGKSGLYLQI
jgi:hypothetical protein